MLRRIHELAERKADFAFETTLSSRTFAPWLTELRQRGYRIHVVFLSLPSADFAVERVADRVRMGGHAVPEDTVRRRYRAGLRNFFDLYRPLADSWLFYDNAHLQGPRLVASARRGETARVVDDVLWQRIQEDACHGGEKP